jgi:hypothetical protein
VFQKPWNLRQSWWFLGAGVLGESSRSFEAALEISLKPPLAGYPISTEAVKKVRARKGARGWLGETSSATRSAHRMSRRAGADS